MPTAPDVPHELCTYFDRHFLPRGLALYASLEARCPSFHLTVLTLDDEAHDALERLDLAHLSLMRLSDLEARDTELAALRASRSRRDYISTLRPGFLRHLLETRPEIPTLTYLDADLFCFADPTPGINEIDGHVATLTPHDPLIDPEIAPGCRGRFNAGWVGVRNDERGRALVAQWRTDCHARCHVGPGEASWGNQGYLDAWPPTGERVRVIQDPGINTGPWSWSRNEPRSIDGSLTIGGHAIQTYHFSGLRRVAEGIYKPGILGWRARVPDGMVEALYRPYVRALHQAARRLGIAPEHVLDRPSSRADNWWRRRQIHRRLRRSKYFTAPEG